MSGKAFSFDLKHCLPLCNLNFATFIQLIHEGLKLITKV